MVVAQTRAADGMNLDAGGAIHLQELPRASDELRKRGERLVDEVLRELEAQAQARINAWTRTTRCWRR